MPEDYISYTRSKVGQDKIFLNFAAGILCDEDGKVLLQLRGDSQNWGVIGGRYHGIGRKFDRYCYS